MLAVSLCIHPGLTWAAERTDIDSGEICLLSNAPFLLQFINNLDSPWLPSPWSLFQCQTLISDPLALQYDLSRGHVIYCRLYSGQDPASEVNIWPHVWFFRPVFMAFRPFWRSSVTSPWHVRPHCDIQFRLEQTEKRGIVEIFSSISRPCSFQKLHHRPWKQFDVTNVRVPDNPAVWNTKIH